MLTSARDAAWVLRPVSARRTLQGAGIGPDGFRAHSYALERESLNTVEQGDAKLLIEIFIEYAVYSGFFEQHGPVQLDKLFKRLRLVGLGPEQQCFEVHPVSPLIVLRSFLMTL